MTQFNMKLPDAVLQVLSRLESHGYEAYVVGGAVRDAMLCRKVHDYDVTTSATPAQTCEIFKDLHTIPTGEKHGTVTVVVAGEPIEVTTYRIDGDYSDGRRPDSVEFTKNITDDLARRDFTVNAMAYSPERGLCDPFGGAKDLSLGLIRAVGDPKTRFTEDSLRILRAFRFAARLGFEIEEKTLISARGERKRLSAVSAERIGSEIIGMLSAEKPSRSLLLMYKANILEVIFPNAYFTSMADKGFAPADYSPEDYPAGLYLGKSNAQKEAQGYSSAKSHLAALRLGILLRDSDREAAGAAPSILRLSCELSDIVRAAATEPLPSSAGSHSVRKYAVFKAKKDPALAFLTLLAASAREERLKSGEKAALAAENLRESAARGEILYRSELKISGADLIAAGFPAGKRLGEILSSLFEICVDTPEMNEREALLSMLDEYK